MVQVRCTGDQFLICSAVHSLVKVLGIKSGDLVTALAHNRSNISQLQPTSNLYMPSSHLFGCLNIPEEIKELSLTCVLRSRLYIYLLRATALAASPILCSSRQKRGHGRRRAGGCYSSNLIGWHTR